jgi:apolipoprotein N-acyltransferase
VWLVAAVTWTAVEYFRSELFWLKFGWMGLGYAVVNFPVPAAGAAAVGAYGVTFIIVAMGAALAAPARDRRAGRRRSAGILGVWILLCLLPSPAPVPARPLTVRLVQATSDDEDTLFALSRPSGGPIDVLVWPEYSFTSDPREYAPLWAKLEQAPRENGCFFIFGAKDQWDPRDEAAFRNTAFVLDPEGRLVGQHVKNHTVHFVRDGVPGKEARAIDTTLGRLGVAICFDMDYPDVARRLAADGAELFLVPNMDPLEWGPMQRAQHRLMFQMRAVECGRWLARADVAGGTSIVAPNGREVARVATTEPVRLEGRVGRETGQTLFVRGGWRFGPACLLVLVGLCVWRGRRFHHGDTEGTEGARLKQDG